MPSLWATAATVIPEPSKRFPKRELIALSSQMRGVREEEVVGAGSLADDGTGV